MVLALIERQRQHLLEIRRRLVVRPADRAVAFAVRAGPGEIPGTVRALDPGPDPALAADARHLPAVAVADGLVRLPRRRLPHQRYLSLCLPSTMSSRVCRLRIGPSSSSIRYPG